MALKRTVSQANTNVNVNWLDNRGIWAWYLGMLACGWLVLTTIVEDAGLAWTYVHLLHGVVSYFLLHVSKGSPIFSEQRTDLTLWEEIDNQTYYTKTRLFFTCIPVLLFILATHGTQFEKQPLGLNLVVVIWLVLAKLPAFHKVRIMGINRY